MPGGQAVQRVHCLGRGVALCPRRSPASSGSGGSACRGKNRQGGEKKQATKLASRTPRLVFEPRLGFMDGNDGCSEGAPPLGTVEPRLQRTLATARRSAAQCRAPPRLAALRDENGQAKTRLIAFSRATRPPAAAGAPLAATTTVNVAGTGGNGPRTLLRALQLGAGVAAAGSAAGPAWAPLDAP